MTEKLTSGYSIHIQNIATQERIAVIELPYDMAEKMAGGIVEEAIAAAERYRKRHGLKLVSEEPSQ